MVRYKSPILDRTFAALADPTRRAIVQRLASGGQLAVSEIAKPFRMSLPAVLKHVGVLGEAGILKREKLGRTVYCRIDAAAMRDAAEWLRRFETLPLGENSSPEGEVEKIGAPRSSKARNGSGRKSAAKVGVTRVVSNSKRPAKKDVARKPAAKR